MVVAVTSVLASAAVKVLAKPKAAAEPEAQTEPLVVARPTAEVAWKGNVGRRVALEEAEEVQGRTGPHIPHSHRCCM